VPRRHVTENGSVWAVLSAGPFSDVVASPRHPPHRNWEAMRCLCQASGRAATFGTAPVVGRVARPLPLWLWRGSISPAPPGRLAMARSRGCSCSSRLTVCCASCWWVDSVEWSAEPSILIAPWSETLHLTRQPQVSALHSRSRNSPMQPIRQRPIRRAAPPCLHRAARLGYVAFVRIPRPDEERSVLPGSGI